MKKKKKSLAILKRICVGCWYCAVIGLAILLTVIISAKLQGKVPMIMGRSLLQITTGSMEPAIPAGTYILVEAADPKTIKPGDIITFYSNDPLIQGMPNTHRVETVTDTICGDLFFHTRGDANVIADKVPVPHDRLIGRYTKTLEGLTDFAAFCSTSGMLLIIVLIQVLCAGMMYISVQKLKGKKEEIQSGEDNHGQSQ